MAGTMGRIAARSRRVQRGTGVAVLVGLLASLAATVGLARPAATETTGSVELSASIRSWVTPVGDAVPGSEVLVVIRVDNVGSTHADGVTLTADLPPDHAVDPASLGGVDSCDSSISGVFRCEIGELAPGRYDEMYYRIDVGDVGDGTIDLRAAIDADQPLGAGSVTSADAVVPVLAEDADVSALDILPLCPGCSVPVEQRYAVGESYGFRFYVFNSGPTAAIDRPVLVGLGDVVRPMTVPDECSEAEPNQFVCLVDVRANGWATLDFLVEFTQYGRSNLSLAVRGPGGELLSLLYHSVEGVEPMADLELTAEMPELVAIGGTTSIDFTVANRGPSATPFELKLDLLDGVTFLRQRVDDESIACAVPDVDSTILQCDELAAGQGVVVEVEVRIGPNVGWFRRVNAEVRGLFLPDPDDSNNSIALETEGFHHEADLSVTSTDGVDTALVGDSLLYDITVTNQGSTTASDVLLTSVLPSGVSYHGSVFTGSDGEVSENRCSYDQPSHQVVCGRDDGADERELTIEPGETVTFQFFAFVEATASGDAVISASVTHDGIDPDPSDDVATDSTTITSQVGDLAIHLDDLLDRPTVAVGDRFRYRVAVTNAGSRSVYGLAIRIELDDEVTLVGLAPSAEIRDAAGHEESSVDCDVDGSVITCEPRVIFGGGSVTVYPRVEVVDSGDGAVRTTATVSFLGEDTNPGDNTDTDVNEVLRNNKPPTATDDVAEVYERRQTVQFDLLANDVDEDGTFSFAGIVTPPAAGSLACDAAGHCTYTSAAAGSYSLVYQIVDDEGATDVGEALIAVYPPPVFTITGGSGVEGSPPATTSSATFTITLTGRLLSPASVRFKTGPQGSVTPGVDYQTVNPGEPIVFPADGLWARSQTVTVPVTADRTREADEGFFGYLQNENGATKVNGHDRALWAIVNDD